MIGPTYGACGTLIAPALVEALVCPGLGEDLAFELGLPYPVPQGFGVNAGLVADLLDRPTRGLRDASCRPSSCARLPSPCDAASNDGELRTSHGPDTWEVGLCTDR